MTNVEIQPGYSIRPQRPASARFLPGDDAREWLQEIAGWDVPQTELELFIVPRSAADLRPRGVLVRIPRATKHIPGWRGHPYGLIGGRLFVPVEAAISPCVSDDEWPSLLRQEYAAWVWHPQSGLVAFEEADRLRVCDLIQPPDEIENDWGRARPGEVWSSRIESIDVERPRSVEDVLAEGRDGIATRGDDLKGMPRGSQEGFGKVLGDAGAAAISPVARAAKWLADHAPSGASQKTWLNGLSEWADEVLKRGANLWNARARELERLMNLLDSDPDEGLKYALPLGGDAPRGVAPPGSRLTRRPVDFSLSHGASGPADYWDVAPDVRTQLLRRYRELAAREVQLGRYRRAAYIYAELLNDLNSAANTLVAGKHYREAAVLFRDRLHRPHDAANCLERGGLLHEAIEIYDELQQHVKVAELYTQLEQHDDARAAWRRAVDERKKHGDFITAASLLEEKLDEPLTALNLLEFGWPDSGQARECLDESFRLMGRLGHHERAAARVDQLRDDPPGATKLQHLVEGLAEAAEEYPDDRVRTSAADATRVVTSRALIEGHHHPDPLLRAVERLAAHDRLLRRDCRRYLRTRRPKLKTRSATTARSPLRIPIDFVRTVRIPGQANWVCARSTSRGFYLAGYGSRELVLVRGAWADPQEEPTVASWKSRLLAGNPLLMSIDEDSVNSVRLFVPGGPAIPQRFLRPTRHFPPSRFAETPAWVSDETIGMDTCGGVSWVVVYPSLFVKCINREGVVISNRELSMPTFEEAAPILQRPLTPALVHAREDAVYIGYFNRLHSVTRTGLTRVHSFDHEIQSIVGTAPHTRSRLAVLFEQGGMVMWPTFDGGEFARLPDSLQDPRAAFLRDGRLIVCDDHKWLAFATQQERLQLKWEYHAPVRDVMAVLPTPVADEFAVVTKSGHLAIYRAK